MSGRRRAWAWFAGACLVWAGVGGAVVWGTSGDRPTFDRVELDRETGRWYGVRGRERWDVSDDVVGVVANGLARPELVTLRRESAPVAWLRQCFGLRMETETFVAGVIRESAVPEPPATVKAPVRVPPLPAWIETVEDPELRALLERLERDPDARLDAMAAEMARERERAGPYSPNQAFDDPETIQR